MITLYHTGGATDFEIVSEPLTQDEWQTLKNKVLALLKARGQDKASELLSSTNFELYEAINYFQDEFEILFYKVPVDLYVEIENDVFRDNSLYSQIAKAFSDIGKFIRIIAVDIADSTEIANVESETPEITSNIINRALADAQVLITHSDAVSAVDRIHTAIHGYFHIICQNSNIEYPEDSNIMQLYKLLKENHPALEQSHSTDENINRIIRAISTIIDSINFLRNRASIAHPNDNLLGEAEAMLAINSVRTIIKYLDSKFISHST